ncbi:hypothetical protein ATH33_1257 [Thermoactinomyces vulgaris]|nr:hypothetical protein ATH33_1257 [Thermoactinomyces vulgaris]
MEQVLSCGETDPAGNGRVVQHITGCSLGRHRQATHRLPKDGVPLTENQKSQIIILMRFPTMIPI